MLEKNKIAACGTSKANRISLPKSFTTEKLEPGDYSFRRNGNLLVIRFQDKKVATMLSTIHKVGKVLTGKLNKHKEAVVKLKLVHVYNMKMGAIDKNDAQVGNYTSVRKSYEWTTKVFLHFVEDAVFNVYIIHKKQGGDIRFSDFKLRVITSMLARCGKS